MCCLYNYRVGIVVSVLVSLPVLLVKTSILTALPQYVLPTISWFIALTILFSTQRSCLTRNIYEQLFITTNSPLLIIIFTNTTLWFIYGLFTKYGVNVLALDTTWYLIQTTHYIVFTTLIEIIRRLIISKLELSNKLLLILVTSAITTLIQAVVFSTSSEPSYILLFSTILLFETNLVLTSIAMFLDIKKQLLVALTYVFLYKLSPIMPLLDLKIEHMFKEINLLVTMTIIYTYYSNETKTCANSIYIEMPSLSTHRFRDKLRRLVNILLTVLILIVFTMFIIGFRGLTVASESMYPVIKKGDLVIINTIDRDIDENDVVSFIIDNKLVIHRVVGKTVVNGETMYITKGDANNDKDPWLLREKNIIGRAVLIIPYIGLLSIYYNGFFPDRATSIGFITVFISLFTIIYLTRKMLIKHE